MSAKRIIDRQGRVRRISVRIAEPVAEQLEAEAIERGVSVGAIVRERLKAGAR